jgi:hypothetical protein
MIDLTNSELRHFHTPYPARFISLRYYRFVDEFVFGKAGEGGEAIVETRADLQNILREDRRRDADVVATLRATATALVIRRVECANINSDSSSPERN